MTHQEVIELLPWYANATLSEGERREVSEHLASCAPCQAEFEVMTVLQQAVVESSEELPAPAPSLLNKAMAQIDSFERARQPVPERSASWLSDLKDRVSDALFGWCGPMPNFARAVVAAQFLLIVGLAGGLGYSLWDREYGTLSGTTQSAGGARIAVRFNESITEAQLRQLLRDIDGKIVDGPSSLGVYTVQVPIAPEKTAEVERLIEALRSKQQWISYVEKVG
jgi:hypothetical protein